MSNNAESSTPMQSAPYEANLSGLLHGMTYQTPTIGAIRIGGVEEIQGQKVPYTDDQFTVTTRFRDEANKWVQHAVMDSLLAEKENLTNEKLRRIPVKIIYDKPSLNMGEQYAAFTVDGRPACVGNGDKARQVNAQGKVEGVSCQGPARCGYANMAEHPCQTFARAVFHIEGQESSEGAFILRTGSYNSVNDLRVRMETLYAGFGRKLAGLPMWLTMRLKSSAQSLNLPFFYVTLEPRFKSLKDGIAAVKEQAREESDAGFDRAAYEAAMTALVANGDFSENHEDVSEGDDLLAGRQLQVSGSNGKSPIAVTRNASAGPDLSLLVNQYPPSAAATSTH